MVGGVRFSITLKATMTRTVEIEADSAAEASLKAVRGDWKACPTPAVMKGWDIASARQLDGPWVHYTGADQRYEILCLKFDRGVGRTFTWDEVDALEKRVAAAGYRPFPAGVRSASLGRGYVVAVAYPEGVEVPTAEQVAAFCAPLDAGIAVAAEAIAADDVAAGPAAEIKVAPDRGAE